MCLFSFRQSSGNERLHGCASLELYFEITYWGEADITKLVFINTEKNRN